MTRSWKGCDLFVLCFQLVRLGARSLKDDVMSHGSCFPSSVCLLGLHAEERQGHVFTRGCSQLSNRKCITGAAGDLQCGLHDGFRERVRVAARDLGSVADDDVSDHAVFVHRARIGDRVHERGDREGLETLQRQSVRAIYVLLRA